MAQTLFTLLIIGVVLAYSIWQGLKSENSSADLQGFFLMNKSLHAKLLGTSFVASNISVATVVLALGVVGYNFGFWGAVWITICWILGIFLFAYLIGREPIHGYLSVGHTLHEFIGEQYDEPGRLPIVRLAASALTIFVFWATIGIEFFAAVIVFMKLGGGLSPMLMALLIALAIIIYTMIGGYRAATVSDWPRLALVTTGFVILVAIAIWIQHKSTVAAEPLFSISAVARVPPEWAIAGIFTLVPVQLSGMDMWQRCVAANGDVPAIRRGLLFAVPLNLLWLVPAYVGALAKTLNFQPTNVNHVVLEVLERIEPFIGSWWGWAVRPLLYASLVATMASVIDTLLMSLIFTFMYDMYGCFKKIDFSKLTKPEEAKMVIRAKYWTGLLGLSSLCVVFAGLIKATIYDLIVTSFALQIILFSPVLLAVFARNRNLRKRRLAFAGLCAGFLAAVAAIVRFLVTQDQRFLNGAPIAAIIVTFVIYLILVLSSPKRQVNVTGANNAART